MNVIWISTERQTGCVEVIEGMIVSTPPVWKKFKRQPLSNLLNWLEITFGEVEMEKLK